MTTTRTPINRSGNRTPPITPEAVRLFVAAVELLLEHNDGTSAAWMRRDVQDASHALHVALGRKPWEPDTLMTLQQDGPPEWLPAAKVPDWWRAHALGLKLIEAAP